MAGGGSVTENLPWQKLMFQCESPVSCIESALQLTPTQLLQKHQSIQTFRPKLLFSHEWKIKIILQPTTQRSPIWQKLSPPQWPLLKLSTQIHRSSQNTYYQHSLTYYIYYLFFWAPYLWLRSEHKSHSTLYIRYFWKVQSCDNYSNELLSSTRTL